MILEAHVARPQAFDPGRFDGLQPTVAADDLGARETIPRGVRL
jgi:hypothetical protein